MIVYVKPAEGLAVRAPGGAVISPEGQHIERDLYVQRRLDDGDLVECEPPAEPAAADPPPPPPPARGLATTSREKATDE